MPDCQGQEGAGLLTDRAGGGRASATEDGPSHGQEMLLWREQRPRLPHRGDRNTCQEWQEKWPPGTSSFSSATTLGRHRLPLKSLQNPPPHPVAAMTRESLPPAPEEGNGA